MDDIINGHNAMAYGIVVEFINYVIDNPSNQSFDDEMMKNFPEDEYARQRTTRTYDDFRRIYDKVKKLYDENELYDYYSYQFDV